MALDWIMGFWHEGTLSSINDGQQIIFQLVDVADLDESDLYVERIVGQYFYGAFTTGGEDPHSVTAVYTHTRVVVRPEDQTTGAVWNAPIAPAANAEEKFLWHKVHRWPYVGGGAAGPAGSYMTNFGGGIQDFSGQTSGPPLFVHPEWSHVDIRVGRKLDELSRLCWVISHHNAGGIAGQVSSLTIGLWIRVLVKGR